MLCWLITMLALFVRHFKDHFEHFVVSRTIENAVFICLIFARWWFEVLIIWNASSCQCTNYAASNFKSVNSKEQLKLQTKELGLGGGWIGPIGYSGITSSLLIVYEKFLLLEKFFRRPAQTFMHFHHMVYNLLNGAPYCRDWSVIGQCDNWLFYISYGNELSGLLLQTKEGNIEKYCSTDSPWVSFIHLNVF